ncbi:MAG: DUF4912 domain-containing protein [Verrucomicrobiota bacterium]|nr:DUF4912 domain-containing protein [Verrucomicrobiota bacterium]
MQDVSRDRDQTYAASDFAISDEPLVRTEVIRPAISGNEIGAPELPQHYAATPSLVSIARDPHTIFAYWDIDWIPVFGSNPPADQKVRLRLTSESTPEEETARVEPFAGSFYISCAKPDTTYRVEIGYYQPSEVWHSVAISNPITTPAAEAAADDSEFNLVNVPFHLHFQRLVDLFRGSRYDGAALIQTMSDLQRQTEDVRGTQAPPEKLADAEKEFLRAMDWKLSADEVVRREEFRSAEGLTPSLRQRIAQRMRSSVDFAVGSGESSRTR